jgi:hypothetical protein
MYFRPNLYSDMFRFLIDTCVWLDLAKDYNPRMIRRDIWQGALKATAKVEEKFGQENLGPRSDFESGMLNGKLSALRWVLGDEWDMLDT